MSQYQVEGKIAATLGVEGAGLTEATELETWLKGYKHKDDLVTGLYSQYLDKISKFKKAAQETSATAFNHAAQEAVTAATETGDPSKLSIGGVPLTTERAMKSENLTATQKAKLVDSINGFAVAKRMDFFSKVGATSTENLEMGASKDAERAMIAANDPSLANDIKIGFEVMRNRIASFKKAYKDDPIQALIGTGNNPGLEKAYNDYRANASPENFSSFARAAHAAQLKVDKGGLVDTLPGDIVDTLRGQINQFKGDGQSKGLTDFLQGMYATMQGESWPDVINQLNREKVLTGGMFVAAQMIGNPDKDARRIAESAVEVSSVSDAKFIETYAQGDKKILDDEKQRAKQAMAPLIESMEHLNPMQRTTIEASLSDTIAKLSLYGKDDDVNSIAKTIMPKFTGDQGSDIRVQVDKRLPDSHVAALERGLVGAIDSIGEKNIYIEGHAGQYSSAEISSMLNPTFVNVGKDRVKMVDYNGNDIFEEIAGPRSLKEGLPPERRPVILNVIDVIDGQLRKEEADAIQEAAEKEKQEKELFESMKAAYTPGKRKENPYEGRTR